MDHRRHPRRGSAESLETRVERRTVDKRSLGRLAHHVPKHANPHLEWQTSDNKIHVIVSHVVSAWWRGCKRTSARPHVCVLGSAFADKNTSIGSRLLQRRHVGNSHKPTQRHVLVEHLGGLSSGFHTSRLQRSKHALLDRDTMRDKPGGLGSLWILHILQLSDESLGGFLAHWHRPNSDAGKSHLGDPGVETCPVVHSSKQEIGLGLYQPASFCMIEDIPRTAGPPVKEREGVAKDDDALALV